MVSEKEQLLVRAAETARRLTENVEKVILGKSDAVKLALTVLVCKRHVLFEDVPGLGKTTLAKAIAQSIDGAKFTRIQGTPDLLPADITGVSVYNQKTQEFEFRPGPVFANIVLADEINRMMPKSQSALLEPMEERQVTIDGALKHLDDPFIVFATQNPIEHEGTYPLPEAQLDRFFLKMALGYPDREHEVQIILDQREHHPLGQLKPVVTIEQVRELQGAVDAVYMDKLLIDRNVDIVNQTRSRTWDDGSGEERRVAILGASPRGSLSLMFGMRAWALLSGRDEVWPEDLDSLLVPILGHRIILDYKYIVDRHHGDREAAILAFLGECRDAVPLEDPQPLSA